MYENVNTKIFEDYFTLNWHFSPGNWHTQATPNTLPVTLVPHHRLHRIP